MSAFRGSGLPPWVAEAMDDAKRDPRPAAKPDQLAAALLNERPRVVPGELSGGEGQPRNYTPITTGEARVKVNRGTVGKPDGPSIKLAD